ncbi:MAG: hypothetical protein WAM24_10385 [Ignavibacteriaceae bacterium]
MKKDELKYKFIELRAMAYTYEKISTQIGITKPTAIKWGKLFSDEIGRQQKYLLANIFSERIVEEEQGIMVKLEQFRRKKKMNLTKEMNSKIDRKILNDLEKIFIKKIKAVHLKIKDDNVTNAVFIFDDDLIIEEKL